jgi:hypothetical protein
MYRLTISIVVIIAVGLGRCQSRESRKVRQSPLQGNLKVVGKLQDHLVIVV